MAQDYYLIIPTAASQDYGKQVMTTVKQLLISLGKDDRIVVINNESQQQCSLSLNTKSVGNYLRLVRSCKGLAISAGEMNSSIPQVTTNLLNAYHLKEGTQLLLFMDPLINSGDELKLATAVPSLGFLEKLGFGITRFSTYKQQKTDGLTTLHVLYPNETNFFNLKHQLNLQNFYGCWATKLGLRLGSFQPINQGINRVLDNSLIDSDLCESDGSEAAIFLKDVSKQNGDIAHEKRGYKEVLYKSNSVEHTQVKYQYTLKKPAYLTELNLTEYDGDADGSNRILVDAITNDDQVIHLARLVPSGNDKTKSHTIKIKLSKPIRDVIILPVTNEGVPDILGGVWGIRLLTVTHK